MGHKLLLADDSITIQKVVELTLSEEGFEVTAVGDGEAAYETAKDLDPDIILADVFMPKLDGYELCRKLKSDPALAGIPVMLLYGTFEDFDDMKAAQVGASDSLTKPFESADLISKVRMLAGQKQAGVAATPAQAAPVEAEPYIAAEPEPAATDSDDLWNVVGMQDQGQPLSDATTVLTEQELWKRANLMQENSAPDMQGVAPPPAAPYPAPAPQTASPDEGMLWDDMPTAPIEDAEMMEEADVMELEAEPFEDAEPMYGGFMDEADEVPREERTAILNMDDLQASIQAPPPAPELSPAYEFVETEIEPESEAEPFMEAEPEPIYEPTPIELSVVPEDAEITTFDSLQDATAYSGPQEPAHAYAAPPAPAAPVGDVPDDLVQQKVREAIAGMSREILEQIAWEVIPDLAEEIINREIQKMKSGTQ
jgi:CheY-like chemotaxis protein